MSGNTHKFTAIVEGDGVVSVEGVPAPVGQRVEVIVIVPEPTNLQDRYPLRGRKPFQFDRPNDPIGDDDWGDGE